VVMILIIFSSRDEKGNAAREKSDVTHKPASWQRCCINCRGFQHSITLNVERQWGAGQTAGLFDDTISNVLSTCNQCASELDHKVHNHVKASGKYIYH
jgi:hypothetical protein